MVIYPFFYVWILTLKSQEKSTALGLGIAAHLAEDQ